MKLNDLNVAHAIVLAAGENTRLKNTPPFMKPLAEVNGSPLIIHALAHASRWAASSKSLVLANENKKQVLEITGDYPHVIQTEGQGAIGALREAVYSHRPSIFTASTETYTLVLCADNTYSGIPRSVITFRDSPVLFASRAPRHHLPDLRFTRWFWAGEQKFLLPPMQGPTHDYAGVWCGPLLVRSDLLWVYAQHAKSLTDLMRLCSLNGRYITALNMECEDHGVD